MFLQAIHPPNHPASRRFSDHPEVSRRRNFFSVKVIWVGIEGWFFLFLLV
jgi:hypothetical protein